MCAHFSIRLIAGRNVNIGVQDYKVMEEKRVETKANCGYKCESPPTRFFSFQRGIDFGVDQSPFFHFDIDVPALGTED